LGQCVRCDMADSPEELARLRVALEARDRIAYEMGRVVLNWTHLETISHAVHWLSAGFPNTNVARIMTSGLPTSTVWEQTMLLLGERDGSEPMLEWFKGWRATAGDLATTQYGCSRVVALN
jgi:hypothetical protein